MESLAKQVVWGDDMQVLMTDQREAWIAQDQAWVKDKLKELREELVADLENVKKPPATAATPDVTEFRESVKALGAQMAQVISDQQIFKVDVKSYQDEQDARIKVNTGKLKDIRAGMAEDARQHEKRVDETIDQLRRKLEVE